MSYQSPWDILSGQAGQPSAPASPLTYSTDFVPDQAADEAVRYFQVPPQAAGINGQVSPGAFPNFGTPPPGAQTFLFPGAINLPASPSADTTIFSFKVPPNWDGFINQIANGFNGNGFLPGSGSLVWRVLQNGQAVKNFDNIQVALGIYSPQGGVNPFPLAAPGIPIYSDDVIALVVNNVSLVTGVSQVYGLLGGYVFPRQ